MKKERYVKPKIGQSTVVKDTVVTMFGIPVPMLRALGAIGISKNVVLKLFNERRK